MSSALPDGKTMWMRAFYDFNPEAAGYVGWSQESGQKRALRELKDGDLMLIYGANSPSTKTTLRSHVLGFVQIDARPIRDFEKASAASQKAKADDGNANAWTYGLPIRRAWRAQDKMQIARIAPKTYDPVAGQGIGVWGRALEADEITEALKIKVTEVSVFGEPPVTSSGLSKEPFANVFKPSRGFPGSSGERTSIYADGETFLYLARFEGDGHALVGKLRQFADNSVLMKIGVSSEPVRRCEELNSGIPPAALGKWKMELISQPYQDRKSAEVVEQAFKDKGKVKLESLGKEFFWGDWTNALLLFSSLPGASRFT
jgi:hypothetical protein